MKQTIIAILTIGTMILSGCESGNDVSTSGTRQGSLSIAYWDAQAGDGKEGGYETKFAVSIDGTSAGESPIGDRYAKKLMQLSVPPGKHLVVIEGYAMKNGAWEKRTAERGYPLDHRLAKEIQIHAGETLSINFLVPDRTNNIQIRL